MRVVIFGMPNKWDSAVNIIMKYRADAEICGLCYYDDIGLGKYDAVISVDEMSALYHTI